MNAESGEPNAAPAGSLTPGELLRTTRQQRGLSIQQAADDLHLDAWIVEALEGDRFSALGAPVYARGHLRKYAALLALPVDEVIRGYERLSDVPSIPTPIPSSTSAPLPRERMSLRKPLLATLAIVLFGLCVWGLIWVLGPSARDVLTPMAAESEQAQPAASAPPEQVNPTDAVETQVGETQLPPVAPPIEAAPAAPEPAIEPASDPAPVAPEPAIEPASDPALAGAAVRLRLEFSGESWAEVYDGEGRRLMFDIGAAGRRREMTGAPPLHVTLGAAGAVSAAVNGEPIVIPRRAGRDATRFVVDAAGEVKPAGARPPAE